MITFYISKMDSETEHSAHVNTDSTKNITAKKNIHKFPKSVFALYIKLYCDKKETKSLKHTSKMIEATKSWLTLSELEKQKFHAKYNAFQQKYSNKLVNCLQKSEPFMKKKKISRSQKNNLSFNERCMLDGENNETNLPDSANVEYNESHSNLVEHKTEIQDPHFEIQRDEMEYTFLEPREMCHDTALQEPSKISYAEPIHPSIKSGKELFDIIQSNSQVESSWTSLPQKERSLYNQAVLTMKRDYLQKYKLYLENLSQRELFNHYNKCFH